MYGADTSYLDDSCELDGDPECDDVFNNMQCSGICRKHNCGAVYRRCRECGEYYYSPTGCWQVGHNYPNRCKCY